MEKALTDMRVFPICVSLRLSAAAALTLAYCCTFCVQTINKRIRREAKASLEHAEKEIQRLQSSTVLQAQAEDQARLLRSRVLQVCCTHDVYCMAKRMCDLCDLAP